MARHLWTASVTGILVGLAFVLFGAADAADAADAANVNAANVNAKAAPAPPPAQRPPAVTTMLKGRASNTRGDGLAAARVQIFRDGIRCGHATTGADGDFAFVVSWSEQGDPTIVLVTEAPSYLPEVVLLRESAAAAQAGLWSASAPRAPFQPGEARVDLVLRTESEMWRERVEPTSGQRDR